MVARELCLFLHVDANAIPLRERAGFVQLAVRRAAPFADPQTDVVWFGGHAAVWYWSSARVMELAGALPKRARFHAEAAYRGSIHADDRLELLQPADADADAEQAQPGHGMEARLWRGGHLLASRWWPQAPSASAWQTFLRGVGLPLSTTPMPEPTAAGLNERSMGASAQADMLANQLQAQWPLLATAVGGLVLALFCWQLTGIAHAYAENSALEKRTAQLEQRLESVISAKNAVDQASDTIASLLALRPPASQTQLMAEIARITPAGDWHVIQWQLPSTETLEVTLKGSKLDSAAIVKAWEESRFLQDVTPTSSTAGELTLRAKLTPLPEASR